MDNTLTIEQFNAEQDARRDAARRAIEALEKEQKDQRAAARKAIEAYEKKQEDQRAAAKLAILELSANQATKQLLEQQIAELNADHETQKMQRIAVQKKIEELQKNEMETDTVRKEMALLAQKHADQRAAAIREAESLNLLPHVSQPSGCEPFQTDHVFESHVNTVSQPSGCEPFQTDHVFESHVNTVSQPSGCEPFQTDHVFESHVNTVSQPPRRKPLQTGQKLWMIAERMHDTCNYLKCTGPLFDARWLVENIQRLYQISWEVLDQEYKRCVEFIARLNALYHKLTVFVEQLEPQWQKCSNIRNLVTNDLAHIPDGELTEIDTSRFDVANPLNEGRCVDVAVFERKLMSFMDTCFNPATKWINRQHVKIDHYVAEFDKIINEHAR